MSRRYEIIHKLIRYKLFNKITPLFVDLWVTYRCNSNCRYCNMPKNKYEMNTNEIFRVIDILRKEGCFFINITGGEPLLRKDICKIIQKIESKKIKINLLTNGKYIQRVNHMLHKLDMVSISLDGPKDIHDFIRGKGTFTNAIKAIELVRNKTKVNILTTITKKNIDSIDFLLNLAKKYNANIFFEKLDTYLLSKDEKELSPTKEDINYLINKLKSNNYNTINTISHLNYIKEYPKSKKNIECFAGKLYLNILPDGSVVPCCVGQDLIDPKNIRFDSYKLCIENLNSKNCNFCDKAPSLYNSLIQSFYSLNLKELRIIMKLIKK